MDDTALAAAILSGPDAIVAADRDGRVTFWNSGAERIFGYTAAEAMGRSLDLIIPERLRDRHWNGWEHVMTTGHSRYGEGDLLAVPGQRQDGTTISVEFTIHPLRDDNGRLTGIAATLRDVTARFEELRELRRRVAAVET
jgi:PAS domain S-box-containing protein